MAEPDVPEAAIEAARAARYGEPVDTYTWDRVTEEALKAALPHLLPPQPDLTAVPWRQGRRKGRNLYAVTGEDWEAHPEIGCLDTAELAGEAAEAHNAALALSWLLAAGLKVRVAPCGGPGWCCGDDGGRFSVLVSYPDPAADLTKPGGVESHGHASPGEALAFARDWCEREGITP